MNAQQWKIDVSEDGTHVTLERRGTPGQILIKAEESAFFISLWSADNGDGSTQESACVGRMCCAYNALLPEEFES